MIISTKYWHNIYARPKRTMHKTIIKRRLSTILLYTYWPISTSLLRPLLLLLLHTNRLFTFSSCAFVFCLLHLVSFALVHSLRSLSACFCCSLPLFAFYASNHVPAYSQEIHLRALLDVRRHNMQKQYGLMLCT